jgi:DNA-binding NarL/FixJ family response regulator
MEQKKTTLLIADEQSLVREGLVALCESTGRYTVIEQCPDGASAVERIRVARPDVALIDFAIPKLFSLEVIRKVREEELPTRMIILSARTDRKLVVEALRSGASGFVTKSGTSKQLLDAISQAASGGIYVSPELALDKIFLSNRRPASQDPLDLLSSREYQVFTMLIDGVRAKEIAARLDLSPKTVDTYRASLMRKLDIHDVAGLVKFAIQRELTSLGDNSNRAVAGRNSN